MCLFKLIQHFSYEAIQQYSNGKSNTAMERAVEIMWELFQNHFISEKKQWEVVTVPFLVNHLIEILSVTPSFDWCLLTLQNNLRTKLCWPILLGSQYCIAHHNECFWCFSATFIWNFFRITKASATLHLAEWKVWKRPHFTCCVSGRVVATLYLGMVLVFMGFGSFPVSETAIKQPQNLKLMREMQLLAKLTQHSILDVSKCAQER